MKFSRFEDTPVWKSAISLAAAVFDLVEDRSFNSQGDLRNQLQRASLSVSNNIAEGFERGTTNELIQFLYIARGSAGETRSALQFVAGRQRFDHLRERVQSLIQQAESISRQLRGWAGSLQNSEIPGQRRMTTQSQEEFRQKQRAAAFWEQLNEIKSRGNTTNDAAEGGKDGDP